MAAPQGYLTVSVDDGHPTDLKTAALLARYGLRATFYIPRINPERKVLDEQSIKELSSSFEIGGHTYGHRPLCGIAENEVRREVLQGKDWLEQVIGKPLVSFCYPQGKFNAVSVKAVKDAGFYGARTCMYNLHSFPVNPFLWGVSTHAYSHSKGIQVRHAILERNFRGLINFFLIYSGIVDWVEHFKAAVEYVERAGGIAHLYLHSWEIDKLNEWGRLEVLFKYLYKRRFLRCATNGEIFALLR